MKKLKSRVSSQKVVPNEKIQPVQWTKQPIGKLMGAHYLPTFNYRLWHVFTFGQKKRLKSSYLDYRLLHVSTFGEKEKG